MPTNNGFIRGAAPVAYDMTTNTSEKHDYNNHDTHNKHNGHAGDSSLQDDDDDYEDVYGTYTLPKEMPQTARSPYDPKIQPHDNLHRNFSNTSQTISTMSSPWGKWSSKTSRDGNDSKSTFKSKHPAGAPSVSRRTIPLSSPAATRFGWMPKTWAARTFLAVTLLEAIADVSIETVLLSRYKDRQGSIKDADGKLSALPVFLMAFGMAHVYQCFLAVDSVINRNSILVFGLVLFNSAFLVYAVIQISEIRLVLGDGVIKGTSQVVPIQILTGAIPIVIGCANLAFMVLAWFLYKDFGWQIYKVIGADRNLKKAHMHYQIFVCLLKFDFFTFITYCLQLVLVVLQSGTAERWVTISANPVSLFLLFFAWYSVRNELKWGMAVFMIGLGGGAGYFSYKLYKIWMERMTEYQEVYKSLTVFTVLALCLLVATFGMSIRCLFNFDMGLKGAMTRSAEEKKLARLHGTTTGNDTFDSIDIDPSSHERSMSYSDKLHFRKQSKGGMVPLQSASTLHLERHNPRLSLD